MGDLSVKKPQRNIGADVIRCMAFFTVVSVHFMSYAGFYENSVEGEKMLLMIFARSFFIICVPLYMMLSGYLSSNKKPNLAYYKKFGKTYFTYSLCSLCCILFSALVLKQQWSFRNIVFGILDFTAAPYAWYVEMYLGLFLIIPFLNVLYYNIDTQKAKKGLIAVMVIVTALPSIINVYNLYTFNWISQPSALTAYNKLIPAWWTGVYPVTYYFIGCYLKEYGLKIKKTLNFLLILLTVVASGLYSYWRSYKSVFAWGDWNSYNSLFNIILTTLVFSFFINVNYEKVPKTVSKLFKKISALCFGAYLVSWIFDTYFYEILNNKIPEFWDRVYYYVLIVPVIFVCSLLLSLIVNKVQYFLEWVIGKILNIFHKKDSPNQD